MAFLNNLFGFLAISDLRYSVSMELQKVPKRGPDRLFVFNYKYQRFVHISAPALIIGYSCR